MPSFAISKFTVLLGPLWVSAEFLLLSTGSKYSHDTCSLEESQQRQDYMELLKIMVLIIIKINEEFCLGNL